jgi:hypothetical protein
LHDLSHLTDLLMASLARITPAFSLDRT